MHDTDEAGDAPPPDLRALTRPHAAEAVSVLLSILRGDDARLALTAAQEILNRGFGRPASAAADDEAPAARPIAIERYIVDP
jgi:hypothetical protein